MAVETETEGAAAPASEFDHEGERFARAALAAGFDSLGYRTANADLTALEASELALHYHRHGRSEGRAFGFIGGLKTAQAAILQSDLPTADRQTLFEDALVAALRSANRFGEDPAGLSELFAAAAGHRRVVVISDSHGHFYLSEGVLRTGRTVALPFLCTGGSARGLANASSRAGYGPRIVRFLAERGEQLASTTLLFKFGQVDLEFVYDFQRLRDGRTAFIESEAIAFALDSARRYGNFLQRVQTATPARIVVSSALPPALSDAAVRRGYVNAHIATLQGEDAAALAQGLAALEMPDQASRTRLAEAFNAELAMICETAGLPFLDDFTPLLGRGGVIDGRFTAPHDGEDHHLSFEGPACRIAAAEMIIELAARGWISEPRGY